MFLGNEMKRVRSVIAIALMLLVGCALPVSERDEQDFVPQDELDVVSLTREGLYYYSRSRYVDAEFRLREALKIAPEAESVQFNLANALLKQNNYEEAEQIFRSLLEKDPESTALLGALAQLYLAMNDYYLALRYYSEAYDIALRWNEYDAASRFARSLSVINFQIGKEREALNYSEQALELSNSDDEVCRHTKLLIAVGEASAASKILKERIANTEQISNVCLIQEAALAAYAEGKNDEVVKLSELGSEIRKIDQITLSTLELLRYASMSEEEREKEYGEDAEEGTPFERFYNGKALETAYVLYWPTRFLEFLQAEEKKAAALDN